MNANNQAISNNNNNKGVLTMDNKLEMMMKMNDHVKKTDQSILEDEERQIATFDPNSATTDQKIAFNKMKFLHYKPFWWRELELKWDKSGKFSGIVESSMHNIEVIIENDEATINSFAFNKFTREYILKRDVDILGDSFEAGCVPNVIVSTIKSYIDKNYHAHFSIQAVANAIDVVGRHDKFNPVADYMKSAHEKWINAGKPEVLDNFFVDSLGVEKSELTTLKTRIFFAEMVTKGMNPEKSADFVLDLVGGQGCGKTRTLRRLGLDWYLEDITNFNDKDQIIKMCASLLVNDDEMHATKVSGLDRTKSFITNVKQTYRVPYGTKPETVTKNCVICRTTNNPNYLNDITGDRRFMPMMCIKCNKTKDISKYSDDEIAMLFGEAFELVENGFDYNDLTDEQTLMLENSREEFTIISEEEAVIDKYLSTIDRDFITMGEMMTEAFNIKAGDVNSRRLQLKISSVMAYKHTDWRKTRRRINGTNCRGWAHTDNQ